MAGNDPANPRHQVVELIREAIKQDEAFREKFQIGNKFRFVRDRLHALLERLEANLQTTHVEEQIITRTASADETVVYVYLYNVHGLSLRTWQVLLSPKVFYEYSVNRPIYAEKSHIERLLKSKQNIVQHAYLSIAVKKKDISQANELKDTLGNSLLKVREGSLQFDSLLAFTHNYQDYTVNSEGELVKK